MDPQTSPQEYYKDEAFKGVNQGLGDGTVLQSSVLGNFSTQFTLDHGEVDRPHASLIDAYIQEIINFISH